MKLVHVILMHMTPAEERLTNKKTGKVFKRGLQHALAFLDVFGETEK